MKEIKESAKLVTKSAQEELSIMQIIKDFCDFEVGDKMFLHVAPN